MQPNSTCTQKPQLSHDFSKTACSANEAVRTRRHCRPSKRKTAVVTCFGFRKQACNNVVVRLGICPKQKTSVYATNKSTRTRVLLIFKTNRLFRCRKTSRHQPQNKMMRLLPKPTFGFLKAQTYTTSNSTVSPLTDKTPLPFLPTVLTYVPLLPPAKGTSLSPINSTAPLVSKCNVCET